MSDAVVGGRPIKGGTKRCACLKDHRPSPSPHPPADLLPPSPPLPPLHSLPHAQHFATRLKDQAFSEPTEVPASSGGGVQVNSNWLNLMHDLYTTNLKVRGGGGGARCGKTSEGSGERGLNKGYGGHSSPTHVSPRYLKLAPEVRQPPTLAGLHEQVDIPDA